MNRRQEKRDGKMTSIWIITILILTGVVGMVLPMASATESTNYAQYNHSTKTSTFTNASWSLTDIGTSKTVTTNWGKFYLVSNSNFICGGIEIGGVAFPGTWYDSYTENHFWNDTLYYAGRMWTSSWAANKFYQLRDDSYVTVVEKWATDTNAWTGQPETNVTLRFTIFKQEPIVLMNYWIKFLRGPTVQPFQDFTYQPLMYEGGLGCTSGVDQTRQLSHIYNGSMAIGYMGYSNVAGCPSWQSYTGYAINRSVILGESLAGSQIMLFGANRASLNTTAAHLKTMLTRNYAPSESYRNLVYAKNQDGDFDCLGYFPSTGYRYIPTGTTEFVYAGGTTSAATYLENPVHNYDLMPYVTWIDDFAGATSTDWAWIVHEAVKYNVSLSFATTTNALAATPYNPTDRRNGTLIEAGDHYYDHHDFWAYQGYATQYNCFENSWQEWYAHTGDELISTAAAGGTWTANTWGAALADCYQNWRGTMWTQDGFGAFDWYNGTDYLFVTSGTSLTTVSTATVLSQCHYVGYYQAISHTTDFDTAGEKTSVDTWFSYLENRTDTITVTMSQWSDQWHTRYRYYLDQDRAVLDLSQASANALIMVPSYIGENGLVDETTDEIVYSQGTKDGYSIFYLQGGHTYKEPYSASVSALVSMTFVFLYMGVFFLAVGFVNQAYKSGKLEVRTAILLVVTILIAIFGITAAYTGLYG